MESELLAVLAMPEKKQRAWLLANYFHQRMPRESTAELTFRLRDEAMSNHKFYSAMLDVHQEVEGSADRSQDYVFWAMRARPIHWVIAALLAKQLWKDTSDGTNNAK